MYYLTAFGTSCYSSSIFSIVLVRPQMDAILIKECQPAKNYIYRGCIL